MSLRGQIRESIADRITALNRRDLARIVACFDEACTIDSPTAGGRIVGRRAIADVERVWADAFPDAAFLTDDVLIEDARAVWIGRVEGTGTGEFIGLPPTGKPFSVPMVLVSTYAGRQIVHERRIYDFTGMLIQLGLLRPRADGMTPPKVAAGAPAPTGAPSAAPVPREQVIAMLSRRRQAFARHDVEAIAVQHAPECVMDTHLAGRVEGPDAIAWAYGTWFRAFPDSAVVGDGPVIVDGDRAAECVMLLGSDTGGFLGLPPTGRPFKLPSVWLYTASGDQFVHVRPVYDFTGMLVQIGLLKARPV